MKNDITNSKVAKVIKSVQTDTKTLKIIIGIVGFLCGLKVFYIIVMKLWFFILLALNHKWLTLFLLFLALIFAGFYSGVIYALVGKLV